MKKKGFPLNSQPRPAENKNGDIIQKKHQSRGFRAAQERMELFRGMYREAEKGDPLSPFSGAPVRMGHARARRRIRIRIRRI